MFHFMYYSKEYYLRNEGSIVKLSDNHTIDIKSY